MGKACIWAVLWKRRQQVDFGENLGKLIIMYVSLMSEYVASPVTSSFLEVVLCKTEIIWVLLDQFIWKSNVLSYFCGSVEGH